MTDDLPEKPAPGLIEAGATLDEIEEAASAVLRSRDDESRRASYRQLVDDLEVAAATAARV